MGFTSNLAIGVYVGFDDPKSLGKYETGAKAALPIFKKFVESAIYIEDMKAFKVPENIYFFPIDYDTGESSNFSNAKAIYEPFKEKTLAEIKKKNMNLGKDFDEFTKFRKFY